MKTAPASTIAHPPDGDTRQNEHLRSQPKVVLEHIQSIITALIGDVLAGLAPVVVK
jgi:hypothetical protein